MLVEPPKKKKKLAGPGSQAAGAATPPAAQTSDGKVPKKQTVQDKAVASDATAKAAGVRQHVVLLSAVIQLEGP